jgi:2-polyprenyl-6-methoxyphenol hydroxylase-like FAD-dependent oxidoreductase
MTAPHALISGAGIAGPAAAHWLHRAGYRTTVVERAPGPRPGGYAVDFRGRVHRHVLDRMGLLDEIHARQTRLSRLTFVDAGDRPVAPMPAAVFAGDVEIARGDLADLLYQHTRDATTYRFGETITALTDTGDAVQVRLSGGTEETYDLVVGADGVHSGVRRLAFPDATTTDLGMHTAIFTVPNTAGLHRAGLIYSEPGRSAYLCATRDPARAIAALHFTADPQAADLGPADDLAAQRAAVTAAFAGSGWRLPELLAALPDAPDLYVGPARQVHAPRWSAGRVVLLGDAAWAAGLGGNGTGAAVVAAYVLAGELCAAGHDHRAAFGRYEQRLRRYAEAGQRQAAGGVEYHVPPTQRAIDRRNRFFRVARWLPMGPLVRHFATRSAEAIDLPDHALQPVPAGEATGS